MKTTKITMLVTCLLFIGPLSPALGETATIDEAENVAQNWISLMIQAKGHWGGSETAEVANVQEFTRGATTIGYFCEVQPIGYIVVSLYKGLAPVKAYSATSNLDPFSEEGLADVIKGSMERVLDAVSQQVGPIQTLDATTLQDALEINYWPSWEELDADVDTFSDGLASREIRVNYQEGEVLLSTHWHQGDPYRSLCPIGDSGNQTLVGCVATAAAQIMKYWDWPPYGLGSHAYNWSGDDSCGNNGNGETLSATFSDTYDWAHMANSYLWIDAAGQWEDENGDVLTQSHLDAAAELCYEVGVGVQMDYGVCVSEVPTYNIEYTYEAYFRYHSDCNRQNRNDYSVLGWFNRMQIQFNANRPVQYRILGHSMVGDGWRIMDYGHGPEYEYHMNYGGWRAGCTTQDGCPTWYRLDALHQTDPEGSTNDEYILESIYPAQAILSLAGLFVTEPFNYRYFTQDITSSGPTDFIGFQNLQFLPEITVTAGLGHPIRFFGVGSGGLHLFSRGDESKGAHISDIGVIKLTSGGSITFR